MRRRMSAHAHSIYRCIYIGHKNLFLYLSADWRLAPNVSQASPFGQVSRTLAIPSNPRTASQMSVRAILGRVAASWRALQEVQRAAWMAAAKEAKSNSRLGQSGALSGFQLFAKINCTLAQFGQEQVDAPPAHPQFPDLAPTNLVITNTGGVIALKLTCPADPGENTIVRGSTPLSQGREICRDFPHPGHLPCRRGGFLRHHLPLHGPLWRAPGS